MSSTIEQAKLALSLMDLTSLNDKDTDQNIIDLCGNAASEYGQVAAVCVFPQFIETALDSLHSHNIKGVKVATVTNFPHGKNDPSLAQKETEKAVLIGANEVDVVFPYQAFMAGDSKVAADLVQASKEACSDKAQLKVIIESGKLQSEKHIRHASEICIEQGADFIKTSTGKVEVNATLEATEYMLDSIKRSGQNVGFKAAGGIKTLEQAKDYIALANKIMGPNWVNSNTFRFGASSLLASLLAAIKGESHIIDKDSY